MIREGTGQLYEVHTSIMAFATPAVLPRARAQTARITAARPVRFAPCRSRAAWMAVAVGGAAVDFSLPATGVDAGKLSLGDLEGNKAVVLYFYPKDATPGCTVEAGDFRDAKSVLEPLGCAVVGVSKDDVESHEDFAKDECLNFPLVSDDGTLCEGYGVWKERNMFGKTFMGIERSTFLLIGGKVVKEWRGVKSGGHAADVVEAVKELLT